MSPRRLARLAPAAVVLAGALAVAVPGAQAQYFGRNKIQYEHFDWHVLKTEHFDVYYYPEAQTLAEHGAHFAEEVYTELESRFDFSLNHRVPLIFYSSNLHFKQTNVTPGFIPDGVGGFFEFLKGRVVIPANGDLHRFRRVVRHELVHVFTYSKLTRVLRDHRVPVDRFLPLWFTEGLAEYWSGEPDFQHEMILRDAVASNFFVPLHDLDRIAGTYVMYKEGEAFCRFVAETYGEEKVLQLIEEAWRDVDFREVVAFVLGEDFDTTSDRWTAWVRAQYLPLLEDADVPTLVSDAVAARGVNMKPVVHVYPDSLSRPGGSRREVVYVANLGGYTNVYAMPVDADYRPTGEPEVLVRGERSEDFEAFHLFESRMDVSSDGLLAFVTKRGGGDVVHVYDLRARRHAGLYHFDGLVAVYSPTWSPDGRRLAFTGIDRGGFADLYVYDRDAERLRQLTHDPYDDRDPDWSPDGRRLVFSSDRTAAAGPETPAYNLFVYDLTTDAVAYVTYGRHHDLSPRWSPDGRYVVFASARDEANGKESAQDLYVADMTQPLVEEPPGVLAEADAAPGDLGALTDDGVVPGGALLAPVAALDPLATGEATADSTEAPVGRPVHRLTAFTSAAFDPVWTDDGRLVFTAFEDYRFTVRHLGADSLLAHPRATVYATLPAERAPWAFGRYAVTDSTQRVRYRRRYTLDVAQGGITQSTTGLGTGGGAVLAFSDVMGDDVIYVSAYSANTLDRSFLENLNVAVTRIHLGRRANFGYGVYRLAGQRYDRGDPEAPAGYPVFYEQVYGGIGLVSYPLSQFRRIELGTSLEWSRKDQFLRQQELETFLLSNSVALVHDNALYGMNGPIDGWRASVGAGYTTDVLYSNVSFYSLRADVRRYFRLLPGVTFASWGMAQVNVGRRARLNLLGGSWSLRGYPFYRLRGRGLWFTSHELRFPLVNAPSAWIPLLAPFGIASIRGAAFVDAAHLWNEGYDDVEYDPGSGFEIGRTLGSAGLGLRVNLFGAMVLRYDFGYRFANGLEWDAREPFSQFFFGWDF
ncbi:MAG TPA: BamA/TamA family outer membrane protein [Rubricoccaceae bacterium]|nr:BamA/TamA family outer membrane protein [Rubricoccaceae bacterium]